MQKIMAALALMLTITGCGGTYLARDGQSDYTIVISPNASPATRHGADELRSFLREMTGADLPVIDNGGAVEGALIVLGDRDRIESLGVDIDYAALGDEGYVLRTVGKNLVIAGGELRGNMYGVYGLLEDHLGCRWFTPELSRIPKSDRLRLPRLDETVIPPLEYREPHTMSNRNADWAARNRMNSGRFDAQLAERHGGKVDWAPGYFVHTFERLIPKKEFYASHPEYFSLVGGERIPELSQLCCTNPEVIRLVTERTLQVFRDNPDARLVSVDQNDCYNYCECDACQALADRESSQMAPVLALVNTVAEAVEREFPGRSIVTLAYQWTRHAPKTLRPRDNVIIRLCSIECCFTHPFDQCDGPVNAGFVRDLNDWAKISNRLWVWNYTTDFSHFLLPFPNLLHRQHNLKLFIENHVTGLFQQDTPSLRYGELSELGAWVHAKLLWNPDYPVDRAIAEFLDAYYGPAAADIRAYIGYIHEKAHRENVHMGCYESPEAELFSGDFFAVADSLLGRAEAAVAGNPELAERVRAVRLGPEYVWVARDFNNKATIIDQERMTAEPNPEYMARLDAFLASARALGIDHLDETGKTLEQFRAEATASIPQAPLTPLDPAKTASAPIPGIAWRSYTDWQDQPEFKKARVTRQGVMERIKLPEHGPTDLFGTVHEGFIDIPRDGVYAFYTGSDDGSMLWVDGKLVVDNGGRHWMQERVGFIALRKGMHRIRASWFNGAGGLGLETSWQGPGFEKEIIPARVLFH